MIRRFSLIFVFFCSRKGLKIEFELAMVNEPSIFELLRSVYIFRFLRLISNVPQAIVCPAKSKTIQIQSTLVISNSKGLSEILRDIRSSTYQVCRIEEKIIWLTTFNKLIGNWTFEVKRYIENIVEKRRNCSLGAISPLFYNIFHLLLGFHV